MIRDDGSEEVLAAALGPRVRRVIRGWSASYRGGCKHGEQWAVARDLRSACLSCASVSGALQRWERSGPCDVCGRLIEAPPARLWTLPASETRGVQLLLRICDTCSDEELTEPDETEESDR